MKKLTELLGKPVLSLYESVTQGVVKDALFDKNFKRLKYLVLFDDNEFQEEKLIGINEIYSNGKNAIIIKNDACVDCVAKIVDEITNPINNLVYTTLGSLLGTATDIIFDEKYYIKKIVLNTGTEIDIENIVTSGKDAMFVQDQDNIVKLCSFKKKAVSNPTSNNQIKVEILNRSKENYSHENPVETLLVTTENNIQKNITQNGEDSAEDITFNNTTAENKENAIDTNYQYVKQDNLDTNNTEKVQQTIVPIKPKKKVILQEDCLPKIVASKNNFLIGRKVTKNIYSFNHELIIKKNTRVTEKTIVIAKSHSKIKELSLYSI